MTRRYEARVVGRAAMAIVGVLFVASATGCVETSLYEKTALDLDRARRESGQKDVHVRALQLQLALAGQEMQLENQQNAVVIAELERRVEESTATKLKLGAELAEKEKDLAAMKADVAVAQDASAKHGAPVSAARCLRPEELKQIEAAASARDPEVAKLVARLDKLLGDRVLRAAHPGDPRPPRFVDSDLVDPWEAGLR